MIRFLLVIVMTMMQPTAHASGAYLFATFKGEQSPMTEQVYFAVSEDGRTWESLNDGKPVLVSNLGEKGVRDPFLIRSNDGKKFFLIGTDLSIHFDGNWKRAAERGSKSIVVWESDDLTHWSKPRLAQVAADDAGCAWAPEAVYDEESGDYLVFWASLNKRDNFAKFRIWACRTKDFRSFGEPFIFIDKPFPVIDTDIVWENGKYYRFSKDEHAKSIVFETSDALAGPWKDAPHFSPASLRGYEGPVCYKVGGDTDAAGRGTWCLLLDKYSEGLGYQPFVTKDLSSGQFVADEKFDFPYKFRHGSVLPIASAEMEKLRAAYPSGDAKPRRP